MPNEAEGANENTNIETGIFPRDIYERENAQRSTTFISPQLVPKYSPKFKKQQQGQWII